MPHIQDRHITLPKWLDDLLFNKLSASYCRKNKDLVVLDCGHKDILGYLGTYFPRSFAESYCIFSQYLNDNRQKYLDKAELSVFDFGCGTGGELVGLVTAISEQLPSVKHIDIRALHASLSSNKCISPETPESVISVMKMADGHGSKCKCCTLDCTYPATREPFLPLSRLIPQTVAGTVANVCRERGSALQGRMQCTAGAVAVHCV